MIYSLSGVVQCHTEVRGVDDGESSNSRVQDFVQSRADSVTSDVPSATATVSSVQTQERDVMIVFEYSHGSIVMC